ncbi:MAG: hypothetical protein GX295_08070 [Syntrophomonadaceae bacterium]|nr:hypothetical protein [Syntrophomonadaceae bacterium]
MHTFKDIVPTAQEELFPLLEAVPEGELYTVQQFLRFILNQHSISIPAYTAASQPISPMYIEETSSEIGLAEIEEVEDEEEGLDYGPHMHQLW